MDRSAGDCEHSFSISLPLSLRLFIVVSTRIRSISYKVRALEPADPDGGVGADLGDAALQKKGSWRTSSQLLEPRHLSKPAFFSPRKFWQDTPDQVCNLPPIGGAGGEFQPSHTPA